MKQSKNFWTTYLLIAFTVMSVLSYGQKYTGLTATASTGNASFAIDNNMGTRWESASADPQWITFDMGEVKTVGAIKLYWEGANAKDYSISFSDNGTDFTGELFYTGKAAGGRTDLIDNLNVSCRYVKMNGTARNLTYGYSIWEFEVYPPVAPVLTSLTVSPASPSITLGNTQQFTVGGLDQLGNSIALTNSTTWSVDGTGSSIDVNGLFSSTNKGFYTVTATNTGITKTATVDVLPTNTNLSIVAGVSATATASSGTASAAFDNNSGTRWESAASDPQWIKVNLGGVKSISDFVITWEGASSKDYVIEGSLNDADWYPIVTKTNMPAGPRTDHIYDLTANAQYIRLTGTARNTGYGHSIYEFKIFGSTLNVPNLTFATPTTVTKNYGDAVFTNSATSSNSLGSITYNSGNTSVATINATTGEVTILSAGISIITATIAANGDYSSKTSNYTLTVTGIAPNLSFLTPTSVTKDYGDVAFANTASSSNSAGTITYSSGNVSVATVNASTGEITIVAAGSAVITATIAANLSYTSTTASYTLTVNGITPNFTLSTPGTINKKLGDAGFTNAATSSNSSGAISYTSGNTGVATVNYSTGEVTIVGVGTTEITATIAANGSYTAQTATYTLIVKYPIGTIKGLSVPFYAQGDAGGNINSPVNSSVLDYKVVTKNGKSWVYNKFTGTSGLDLGAAWTSQFRYWSVSNAKTENNLTTSRNGITKVVLGSTTSTIPSPVQITFFQNLLIGGFGETLLTNYNPTINNSPVIGDATAPIISACNTVVTETSATLTITGSDNSGDLFYHIEDVTNNIDEFALEGTYMLSGLTLGLTYNLSITPIDFTGNEGSAFGKQFTCSSNVSIASSIVTSSISACPTCSFTVSNGAELIVDATTTLQNITVSPGGKLTVQTGKTLNLSTLTLNSDVTGTGTFVDNGTSNITTSTVKQHLTNNRNWYISSPVTSALSAVVTTAGSLWSYNEANSGTVIWTPIVAADTPLEVARGYVAKPTAEGLITFTGTLNTGTIQNLTLTRQGTISSGFNLVGNPYPSYVNMRTAINNGNHLEKSIWYRTRNLTNTTYYFDTYNTTSTVGTNNNGRRAVTGTISPMQSVWVRVAAGQTSGSLSFNNTLRLHQNQNDTVNLLKVRAVDSQQVLRLQVSNNINSDEAIVLFNTNAMDGFDAFDSPKMTNNNAIIPEIYTTVGDEQLVINGLSSINANKELALGFTTGTSNTFAIKATQVNNFDADTKIILKDNLLNKEQEITDGSAYIFTSDAVNTSTRFSIIFKTTAVTTRINSAENHLISIYRNANNQISINCNGIIANEGIVTVCNAIGQQLVSTSTTGTNTVITKPISKGIYFVTVNIGGNKTTNKVIIN